MVDMRLSAGCLTQEITLSPPTAHILMETVRRRLADALSGLSNQKEALSIVSRV